MDSSAPPGDIESKSIISGRQHSRELQKAPGLPPLSEADMIHAGELAKTLIRSEDQLDDIVIFGSDAQTAVAQIARDMLSGVRVSTLDEVIALSDGVLSELQTLDLAELAPAARRFLFVLRETTAAIEHRVKNFFRRFELVNTRLDRQEADVFKKQTEATERYHRDAALARTNYELVRDAHIKLMAIKIFLDGEYGYAELYRRQQRAAEEQAAAQRDHRAVDYLIIIAAERYAKYIERLEVKANALHKMLALAYQTTIAIRLMADNENTICQKLSDIRTDLLPMWRTNIAIASQAYQQWGISRFVVELEEAEEEIRYLTADQLEQAAKGIYALTARPFNVAAMQYYNEKLASSLAILKAASAEARKNRVASEEACRELITELGDAVAEASTRAR